MQYENSSDLIRQMAEKTGGTCILAFSCGKDAVASWIELREHFHTIIPVYYYLVPDLSFVEQSLRYYENFFQTRIIRLPNPNLYRMLDAGVYQTPAGNKVIASFQFPRVTRESLIEDLKADRHIDPGVYTAIGNRMYDNITRYRSISRHGAVNDKNQTFYPIYDFRIADVVNSIKKANVKLAIDYHLWGKTFDGVDYRFLKPIKDHYPADYEKIKSFFPLVDLEILRYEQL